MIFSVEEFAVFDGEGIRINVFFKGCPLRCRWCHNPEGWLPKRQIVRSPAGCTNCGMCRTVCPSPRQCIACGACISVCPNHVLRFSGAVWNTEKLSERILRFAPILRASGGGVTFSGGEVLMQNGFLCELLDKTEALHRAIETSGYAPSEVFERVLARTDFVFYDLKLMDDARHRMFTGAGNAQILQNARILMNSGVPHIFRVPLIRGVNTDDENLRRLDHFLAQAPERQTVEFLSYNRMAGAKYKMLGWKYPHHFEPPDAADLNCVRRLVQSAELQFSR